MNGLVVWEVKDRKIFRIDYSQAEDPLQLLRLVLKEQAKIPGDYYFSLVDFAYKSYSQEFINEYKRVAREISNKKIIISAYLGLIPDLFLAAKEAAEEIKKGHGGNIQFFEAEFTAIEWLLSFSLKDEASKKGAGEGFEPSTTRI